jgi:hypothetical protein
MEGSESLLSDDYETLIKPKEKNSARVNDKAVNHERIWKFCRVYFAAFA